MRKLKHTLVEQQRKHLYQVGPVEPALQPSHSDVWAPAVFRLCMSTAGCLSLLLAGARHRRHGGDARGGACPRSPCSSPSTALPQGRPTDGVHLTRGSGAGERCADGQSTCPQLGRGSLGGRARLMVRRMFSAVCRPCQPAKACRADWHTLSRERIRLASARYALFWIAASFVGGLGKVASEPEEMERQLGQVRSSSGRCVAAFSTTLLRLAAPQGAF